MRNNGLIIGISGKRRSGKDTLGKYIQEWNKTFVNKKFADKIKDMICVLLNCTREQLEDEEWRSAPLDESWWSVRQECDGILIPFLDLKEKIISGKFEVNDGQHSLIRTSPRLLMQMLGTDCGRKIIHPNIWVNATFRNFTPILNRWNEDGTNQLPNWVITDVRFPNEVQEIERRGGFVIRVNRPEIISTDRHESETALDNWEFYNQITTNSMDVLKTEVEKILTIHNIKRL